MADAVVPGRFQPPHVGHAYMIELAVGRYDEVYIGVATHEQGTERNPLSYEDRRYVLEEAFEDVHVYEMERPRDPDYVERQFEEELPEDVEVVTGNEETEAFVEDLGVEVRMLDELADLTYSGTRIRQRARQGDSWRHLVPDGVDELLDEVGFEEQLRRLSEG
ncbi:MAG: adenylyltransferase/cytidyltransferase family protein [Candidatus Nanohaloarchaea archaeon]|nr:adenylyltransferase/cytidyltransferase family protein [Candidatus Nanohaloarchaea archaeon]